MSTKNYSAQREQQIRTDGMRKQLVNLLPSSISMILMGLIVTLVAQEHTGWAYAVSWFACVAMVSVSRIGLHLVYKNPKRKASDDELVRYALGASFASGLTWGLGAFIAYFYAPAFMLNLIVPMLVMLGAVATFASASYLAAFKLFFYGAALPAIATFFVAGKYALGMVFLVYVAVMNMMVQSSHRRYREGVNLRLDNIDLVQALREQKAQAEEANLEKSRFLAAASHDLRQPMHALSLFIESLASSKLPEYEMKLIANMRKSSAAMETLFDALLDVSRLDAGIVEPRPQPVALHALMQRLHTEFQPLAQTRELAMRLYLPRAQAWVHTDETLLARIVSNILSNAVRYGARTGILLAVRSWKSDWSIEVWDTGEGIPEADQTRIFNEFYQVGNPERDRSKGLGLGLAIVDRLVKLLHLRLGMRSQLGRGTMFRVLVPKIAAPLVQSSAADSINANDDLTGLFVLVIDDEEAICEAMAALLKQWGCNTLQAGSGEQMKAQLVHEKRIPDLIICDYRLRGEENGIDVIEELRCEYNQDIPGLIVTGDTMPERLKQAAASGLPIAHKPLNPARLRALVQASRLQS
jgi:two-component system, sensor histidine kinase